MTWIKSSKCAGGDCLEVDLEFRKSTASSETANCVEVAYHKSTASSGGACVEVAGCTCDEVRVRDSKDPDGPVLVFTRDEWRAFLDGAKKGEFDV
jgi:Domain of unknown function (DUF397)